MIWSIPKFSSHCCFSVTSSKTVAATIWEKDLTNKALSNTDLQTAAPARHFLEKPKTNQTWKCKEKPWCNPLIEAIWQKGQLWQPRNKGSFFMWKTRPRAWRPDNPIFLQFICSLHSVSFSLLSVPCFALGAGVVRSPDSLIRHRGNPSPCGQNPLDFEFNSLAARRQCRRLAKTCIFS